MYPIKFENLYFEKIWGGRDLENFRDNMPSGNIGESWDISCHENGMNVVSNGTFKGMTFDKIIDEYGTKLLGENIREEFPLLVKLINSNDKLSVQVHPGDEYAHKFENSKGKTEAWYVVDAKEGAQLIVGTKDCDKEKFAQAIKSGVTEEYINKIDVKKGDCFLINSGLVHAICEGVIIAEIQQNSDITYRIYDYGRPREIHVEKSLDVINFSLSAENIGGKDTEKFDGFEKVELCKSEYFTIEKYIISSEISEVSDKERFFIFTCVDGSGYMEDENKNIVDIKKGDSIFIPADLGKYKISGDLTVLKSYV
ncbi:type I phosphomannose isomerase catalytic subunit [uncultured Clostridium sp.]|uniref:type I phosphomannose isomerase catalytic subunit n=1 Tax=uncultured Clostridium sp. TaxID=59620 RepID=UPI00261032D2|nr:type I phosphomannose isomerase catalytic subunit [uncultured Clostridium sp.]